ncbi:MAG: YdcF family protein [Ruminococcaceae bacterium]|nr:YdcF family protein [Oscillospiraceae bacterium]
MIIKKHLFPLILLALGIASLITGAAARLIIFQALTVALLAFSADAELIYLSRQKARYSFIFSVAAVILSAAILLAASSFIAIQIKISSFSSTQEGQGADCMILLGAETTPSGQAGELLAPRIETAADYLLRHPNVYVIACGGMTNTDAPSEASVIKEQLTLAGVSPSRIIEEADSLSTEENLINAKAVIQRLFPDTTPRVLAVSSDFHLYRISLYAKELGLDCSLLGAPTDTSPLFLLNCLTREYAAIVHFYLGL